MKRYRLLISFAVACILFVACSEEIAETSETGNFSVSFSVKDPVITKAGTDIASGYSFATVDEVAVQRCFIGFYDGDTYVYGVNVPNDASFTSGSAAGSYKVSDIKVPYGKPLSVFMVANQPVSDNYKNMSLPDLKAKTVNYTNATEFVPSELIKVGEVNTFTFTDQNKNVDIPLKQLAAKIKLTLAFESIDRTITNEIAIDNTNVVDILNAAYTTGVLKIPEKYKEVIEVCKNAGAHGFNQSALGGHDYYIGLDGESHTCDAGGTKWFVVKGDSLQRKSSFTWTLPAPLVTINNIVVNSSYQGTAGDKMFASPYTPTTQVNNNLLDITFYTYQKELLTDSSVDRLNVSISGELQEMRIDSIRKRTGGKVHAVWADANGQVLSGWGNGTYILASPTGSTGFQPWTDFEYEDDDVTGNKSRNSFSAFINPKKSDTSTNGLLSGNYYEVKGKVKVEGSSPAHLTVDWEVVLMGTINVDVPDFE